MNFNIETAYLTTDNGFLKILQSGEEKKRIDNVHILLDNNGVITVQYTNFNYRNNNNNYYRYYNESLYSLDQVLPEYIEYKEEKNITYKNFLGFKYGKQEEIIKVPYVVNGLVRLNLPTTKHALQYKGNYLIEYNKQIITG